jgi:hypothetical protein
VCGVACRCFRVKRWIWITKTMGSPIGVGRIRLVIGGLARFGETKCGVLPREGER